jgi:CheY-like chemotaxis protein
VRILIAEDDTAFRTILRHSVERFGPECLAAEDGEKAWERFQSTSEHRRSTESFCNRVGGPAAHAGQHVGVGIEGDRDGGMSE